MDIKTAEITAKMVNTGKIFSGLLEYLTSPKNGIEGTAMSKEAKETECKEIQTSKGTSSTAKKKPKPPGPVHEHQGLEQVLNQKRVESHPNNDSDRVMVAGGPTPRWNSALEDTSAVGENPSEVSAAATIGSPKEGKASKNQGRKQPLKERIKDKAICAVSAYPTQRPPRKKPARNAVTIKESRQKQRLGSAERDPEQVPTARSSILKGSDHEDREANGLEQLMGLEESSHEDHGSEERDPVQVPAAQSLDLEELFQEDRGSEERDPEQVPAAQSPVLEASDHDGRERNGPEQLLGLEVALQEDHASPDSSSECLEESLQDDHASPESSLEGHEESKGHTPEEALDRERIATKVDLAPSDSFHGEDPITTADEPAALSLPTRPRKECGSGAKGLLWAYAINTEVDEALDDAGVFLWRKPNAHFRAQRLLRTEQFGYSDIAPVVVSHENTGDDEPIIEFDGDTVHIVPHGQCWEDVRSHVFHPDFLVPWKLAEYQACEAAGYQVWRHDRDFLKCRKSACKATVSDYHRSVVVCLGCGPKSIVRYCSLRHQLDDIEEHWKECGTWKVVLRQVIDHTTAPSRFDRMYPAIKQRHGSKTAALHRQRLHFELTCGHYTLFDLASDGSKTLCWPKQDPKWVEMDRRIERLLNIAFLDSWNHVILGYLYRLLRELLRSGGEWSYSTERLLKLQLESEFSDYKVNPNWRNGDAPCECEWSGKTVPRLDHLPTCWAYTPVEDDDSPVRSHHCIERTVEDYEEKYWILRAWRQQHPMENNWRRRAAGFGFPNTIPDEGCYKLGPAWTGWGGENDNIREDQRDQKGKRSMR